MLERRDEDAEAQVRLRSIDLALTRMAEDLGTGRADMLLELRADIAHLTRAVRALGAPGGR